MVIKSNKSLLGEDWFKNFCAFRIHPKLFLDKRKLTRDAFCLDVLKDLYLDHVEVQYKIHLLLLLQEHSTLLITEFNLLEQVVCSLITLCNILGAKSDKRLLKNQALVTIVTILLSQNLDTTKLIIKVKTLLLEIIYNNSDDSTVLSTACKCLEELEEFFPGSLESEMTNVSVACERQMSPSFQSYALLLSVCLKHFTGKLLSKKNSVESKGGISHKKSDAAVAPFAALLFELLPFMTPAATYRVLRDLICVVQRTPELSPTSFKLYLQNLLLSSDVSLFHLAFELLDAFHSDLFSPQDEKLLYKQLIKLSTHPCLTSSHRLLFLDWLKSCVMNSKSAYFSSLSHHSDLKSLLPSPFDGPLAQEKKSRVLAYCIPFDTKEDLATDFLNETVSGLIKCSLLSGGTKAAPSLFRILFVYFSSRNSELMHNSMYRLLSGIMKTSPHLMPYALSFLQSVKRDCPASKFHERILGHLVEHIVSMPMKQFCNNLQCYLAVLENASQECASISRPRAVLKLLQKLLNSPDLNLKNSWSNGNDMLSICRSFMKHHDVQIFYYDLAEVLCLVQNINDADVKDRAKIYYSMLTSLSNSKIQSIFQLHSSEKNVISALSSFVTGNDARQFVSSIQKLTQPILQLIRYEQNDEVSIFEDNSSVLTYPDILKNYEDYLLNHEPVVKLPFILKHVDDVEETFESLYSIVITTQSSPPTKDIFAINLPVLKKATLSENKEETIVFLSIVPVEPYPLTLHFEAEFTCKNGYSYTCDLPSADILFEDLFMPLPSPESAQISVGSWRNKLFDALWEHFKQQMLPSEKNPNYCQSSFCLNMDKENFSVVIERKWKNFIVSRPSDSTYNIAMYLPPKFHLLLKISVVNEKIFAHIIVDKCAILPWVTSCLQKM